MVDSKQFLSSFPYLYNFLGITDIKQVKEKLKFKGKINTQYTKNWEIIGISYNPYSFIELNLTIQQGSEKHKIIYREKFQEYKGEKLPNIRSRELSFIQNFCLSVVLPQIDNSEASDNIEFFPTKKAS